MLRILTPTQLSVVALRMEDDASISDIAEILGISHQAVVARLDAAGRRLLAFWPELEAEAAARRRDRNKRSSIKPLPEEAWRVLLAAEWIANSGQSVYCNAVARLLRMERRKVGYYLHQLTNRGYLVRNGSNGNRQTYMVAPDDLFPDPTTE